jgi:methyl-accepting chemotaxis protein
MSAMGGRDQRNWLNHLRIEEDFTKRQVLRIMFCAGIYVSMSTVLLCVFYGYFLDPSRAAALPAHLLLGDIISRWGDYPQLHTAVAIWVTGLTGMSALFAFATAIYMTRRLVGPLYRLKLDLGRIIAGETVEAVRLRKGDELQDLAELFNGALAVFREREDELRQQLGGSSSSAELELLRRHVDKLDTETLCESDALQLESWLDGLQTLLDVRPATDPS